MSFTSQPTQTLGLSPPGSLLAPLQFRIGDAWVFSVILANYPDGSRRDLTGATVSAILLAPFPFSISGANGSVTVADAENGELTIIVSPSQTKVIPPLTSARASTSSLFCCVSITVVDTLGNPYTYDPIQIIPALPQDAPLGTTQTQTATIVAYQQGPAGASSSLTSGQITTLVTTAVAPANTSAAAAQTAATSAQSSASSAVTQVGTLSTSFTALSASVPGMIVTGSYTSPTHAIQLYGGVDDGATSVLNAAVPAAVTALPGTRRLRFPFLTTGVYSVPGYLGTGPLVIEAEDGVVLNTTGQPQSSTSYASATYYYITSLKYGYWAASNRHFNPLAVDRQTRLSPKDADDSKVIALNPATDLSYFVFPWLTDGPLAADTPASIDSTSPTPGPTYTLPTTDNNNLHFAAIPAVPGDELACYFPGGDNYNRCIVIWGSLGWSVVLVKQDGTAQLVSKLAGQAYSASGALTWQDKTTLLTYHPAFAELRIRVINQTTWTLLVNGMDVFFGQGGLGLIEYIGFGVQALSSAGSTLNEKVAGWIKQQKGMFGGTQCFEVTFWGDSKTADLHGAWPTRFRDWMEESKGCRVPAIDNRAVGGHNSAQQLDIMKATAHTSGETVAVGTIRCQGGNAYQAQAAGACGAGSLTGTSTTSTVTDGVIPWLYVQPSGLGTNPLHFVALLTNDIQQSIPIGDVGVAGSSLDNLSQMFALIQGAFFKAIYIVPSLWYGQSNANAITGLTGVGQNTSNYGGGTAYRLAAERLCASRGVSVLDPRSYEGPITPLFLTPGWDQGRIDPAVRDVIHPTTNLYARIAYNAARKAIAVMTPNPDKSIGRQALPLYTSSGALINAAGTATGWTIPGSNQNPAIYRDEAGVAQLSGYLAPPSSATTQQLADNYVVMRTPAWLRPTQAPLRFNASTGVPGGATIVWNPNGEVQIQGFPSVAAYLDLSCMTLVS